MLPRMNYALFLAHPLAARVCTSYDSAAETTSVPLVDMTLRLWTVVIDCADPTRLALVGGGARLADLLRKRR